MYSFAALVSESVHGTSSLPSVPSCAVSTPLMLALAVLVAFEALAGAALVELLADDTGAFADPLPELSAGTSSGCCWKSRCGNVVPKNAPSTPLKRDEGGVYVSRHVGQKSFTPSTPGKSDRPDGSTFV